MTGSEIKGKSSLGIEERFQKLVDERNLDLWQDLNKLFDFELDESPEPGYLTYFDNGTVIIEVDMAALDPAAFTHELLHVFMKACDIKIAWDLKDKVREMDGMESLFSTSLRVHMGNCLEHVKMLPLFLKRGYSREEFIMDFHQKFMNMTQLLEIQGLWKKDGKIPLKAADVFIEKFFSMKASPNEKFDYDPYFRELEKIDGSLYLILDRFWRGWLNFKIGDPREDYLKLLDKFLREMEDWRRVSIA